MRNQICKVSQRASAVLLITLMVNAHGHAQHERRKGPPPEAKEACVNKAEGEEVTFETRRGDSKKALCQLIDDELVAVPEDHDKKRKRRDQRSDQP